MPYADKNSAAAVESRRRSSRRYYAKNRLREIDRCARWNRDNQSKVNAAAVVRRSKKLPIEKVLFWNARNRAKAFGIDFSISVSDISVPTVCPVLGTPLIVGTVFARPTSPSLDRIDPERGYVPGNIQVISHKANSIKNNATLAEIRAVLRYMENNNAK